MRVLFDVGHPAHVHLFKNTFKQLIEDGHKVYLTTKNNPSIISLLEENDLNYKISGKSKNNLFFKGVDIFKQIWITYFFCLNKKIDIGIS
jgi:predicted glycosyltransferase